MRNSLSADPVHRLNEGRYLELLFTPVAQSPLDNDTKGKSLGSDPKRIFNLTVGLKIRVDRVFP